MRSFLVALFLALAPAALPAQALEQRIAIALQDQGYWTVSMDRTWLGRLRVIAQSDLYYRELIFDPATGEVLQDYVALLSEREQRLAAATRSDPRRSLPAVDSWSETVSEPMDGVVVMVPEVSADDAEEQQLEGQ